jgi:hypothetical protein
MTKSIVSKVIKRKIVDVDFEENGPPLFSSLPWQEEEETVEQDDNNPLSGLVEAIEEGYRIDNPPTPKHLAPALGLALGLALLLLPAAARRCGCHRRRRAHHGRENGRNGR